jgi:hypothetical protein
MVPTALNNNRIPKGEGGAFFKAVLDHTKWPQGVWVVAPDGKVLAFHYFKVKSGESYSASQQRWVRETLAAVEDGLKAFGPVEPRPPRDCAFLPDRGVGCDAGGGARLAVYGGFARSGRRAGDPVVDSVALGAADWAAFAPAKAEAGHAWDVPEAVARQLAKALGPMTDSIYTPQAKDATKAALRAEVDRVDGGLARVRLSGTWETLHHRDNDPKLPIRAAAKAEGVAFVDAASKQVRALLLVFEGTYRNVPPWDEPKPTAAVVEWRAK